MTNLIGNETLDVDGIIQSLQAPIKFQVTTQDIANLGYNGANAATIGHLSGGTTSSTNANSLKATPGTLWGVIAINTTGTIGYLRLYDLATTPTPSSGTGCVSVLPIPASTSGSGLDPFFNPVGAKFSNGIAYCVTGGGADTDNTSGPAGIYLTFLYT